ncbi:NrpR regulatory domain-containing protein [Methanobrevibacter arboriphilus]|uniref:NrpR regulatory domain-containing protein n=1 Tax=Methanobrevibacter arboriphilus TaxID=39441 RepID=UPI001CDA8B21|nr:NrpR regulatory domain-containing protein [Methanobrevibacter arboriphilus]
MGKPRELVYNAKVDRYNFGFVTGSGLNQIAAIKESGIDVNIKAVQGTIEIDEMELL